MDNNMKQVKTEINTKATGELQVAIAKEMEKKDKSIKDLINENAEHDKDGDSRESQTDSE